MTTNISISSLSTLPVELIYRILNILDNETILFSFGNVCKRFQFIIHTYNQYKLNFQSISKPYFDSICQLIHPENIISLTLSNDNRTPNQIKCFFSFFQIQQFICLRSLKLIDVDEDDFHRIFQFKHILISLAFTFRNNVLQNSETLPLISSIISNNSLRQLDLFLSLKNINDLLWPNQCLLQSLILSQRINFKQFSTILSYSLQLKTIVLQDCIAEDLTDNDSLISYPQLISLTFDDSELNMNECQIILSLTPSLEHFHIVGGRSLSNGLCWEEFIKKKLLKLNKFEFAFCGDTDVIFEDSIKVESLMTSFRTPFWIDNKHWFVVCYYFKNSAKYSLYSLPICKSKVRYYPHKDKISCSTYSNFYNDVSMTDSVREMQLNLTNLMAYHDQDVKNTSASYPFFRKLNKILLFIDNEWPIGSVEYLSTFIDLSCIVELIISIDFDPKSVSNKLTNITHLLKKTLNLYTLTIDSTSASAENICLLVPDHIKHLQVSVQTTDDIKLIIEQLKHLSSVTFEVLYDTKCLSPEFVTQLMEKRNQSTYRNENMFLSIWFNNKSN
ncbi:unnamed protein product [Rotaria sp. Silwood2]|nr:unnamed protein product [Rotaria sp. Silwood2]CAF2956642.1 unnamed protein product [Rotaria sp. Silwood2]CAF3198380.1 unnamed protein product [Rotaria sp. Silwood2]CAF3336722.1 unnamed protein product [Rotaria sp. Silwood2]CAF4107622.1 unnamed protein product [Rotaria sp. Silwood2]